MNLGFRLSASVRLTQTVALTVTQRAQIKSTLLTLRLGLVGRVHGGDYKPRAQCPRCQRTMTALEIISGFLSDPNDYTTACTSCNYRFEPQLVYRTDGITAELPFYCSSQVLAQLPGLESMKPEEIQKSAPAIYHSVRVHHGNFRIAFEKIGIQYAYESVSNWQDRVRDFLGKLPDKTIAEVVDMSVNKIRALRNSLGISTFSRRRLLEEEQ